MKGLQHRGGFHAGFETWHPRAESARTAHQANSSEMHLAGVSASSNKAIGIFWQVKSINQFVTGTGLRQCSRGQRMAPVRSRTRRSCCWSVLLLAVNLASSKAICLEPLKAGQHIGSRGKTSKYSLHETWQFHPGHWKLCVCTGWGPSSTTLWQCSSFNTSVAAS